MLKGLYIPIEKGLGEYTGCVRTSFYVDGSEPGVKIAVDLYLPADEDQTVPDIAFPTVIHTGAGGRRNDQVPETTLLLVANGFAHLMCDSRGIGPSFGVTNSFAGMDQANDIKSVIEWCAAQKWCNGKIGMRGISNKGFIQHTTACTFPDHLVSIAPGCCNPDFYYVNHPNGVNAAPTMPAMGGFPGMPQWQKRKPDLGTPVDEDPAPAYPLATEAVLSRQEKTVPWFMKKNPENECRDWVDPALGYAANLQDAPVEYMDQLKENGCKMMQYAGWFDSGASAQLMYFKQLGTRIIVGPWNHGACQTGWSILPEGEYDIAHELLLWFNETLKGIPSGRPNVKYYTVNAPEGQRWKESEIWPPQGCRQIPFYLGADGSLSEEVPAEGSLNYTVRDDIKVFDPFGKFDMNIQRDLVPDCDAKGLTFTTQPLAEDTELTGHFAAELTVSSTAKDGNFMAVLEDVTPDGKSRYVTSGCIRATHRKVTPYEMFNAVGVPYHRSLESELEELVPGEQTVLDFCIDAASFFFPKGDRIRITIVCAEAAVMCHQPPCIDMQDPPKITLYTGPGKSRVLLSIRK